ncbi:MAG TPA: hypothetical protein VEQ59_18035 [Polyangiaceae bacterium]|nr:hypothetical protein [Polyangiaceae bacterium]
MVCSQRVCDWYRFHKWTVTVVAAMNNEEIQMRNRVIGAGFAALLMALGAVGCSDTVDEISNKVDCHSVCKRYADCFDSDYDVDGCKDKCENSTDSSDARQRKLDSCDDCLDSHSCTGAAFSCADECVGIVP